MEHSPAASWADTLAVFDLETTGIDIDTCRIVTAHVGVIGPGGEVLEQRQWLVDPGVEIPTAATLIHGVTTERARLEGLPAVQATVEIIEALTDAAARGLPIVAYNAAYDLSVLHREAERYGHEAFRGPAHVVDPLVIDKAVDRYRRGKRKRQHHKNSRQHPHLLPGRQVPRMQTRAGQSRSLCSPIPARLTLNPTEVEGGRLSDEV